VIVVVGEAEVAAMAEIRLVHVIGHGLREFISVFFFISLVASYSFTWNS